MSSPGGFSSKRFWGIQVTPTDREKNARVNSGTELHISKAIVELRTFMEPHQVDCFLGIGVRYDEDRCDCPDVRRHLGEHCGLHPQQNRQCIVSVVKLEKDREADLDLHFVGRKNLTFYYTYHCTCESRPSVDSVNLTGYVLSY